MARLAVLLLPAALALRLAPRMGPAAPRPLGGMESLFAPRRSLASCALPPTAHVVAVRLERRPSLPLLADLATILQGVAQIIAQRCG